MTDLKNDFRSLSTKAMLKNNRLVNNYMNSALQKKKIFSDFLLFKTGFLLFYYALVCWNVA